jgi:hypothetical protein
LDQLHLSGDAETALKLINSIWVDTPEDAKA